MRHVSWVLVLISILLGLVAIYSKFAGQGSWILGYAPQSWWRVSLLVAIWGIASRFVCPFSSGKE